MLFCTKLTFDAFWEWGLSLLDWEWRWKSMNNIPTLQMQRVQRVGTKSKVAEEPALESALQARPWQVGLSFVGFLEIPEKHQGFVHCWSFGPSDVCVWGQTRYHSLLHRQIPLLGGGGQDSPSCLSIPVIQRLLQVCKTYLEPTARCCSDWLPSAGVGLYRAMPVKTFSLISSHRQRMPDFSMHCGVFPCWASRLGVVCLLCTGWFFSLAQVSYFLCVSVPQLQSFLLSFPVLSVWNKPHPPHQWVLTMGRMTGAMRHCSSLGNTQQKTICLKIF